MARYDLGALVAREIALLKDVVADPAVQPMPLSYYSRTADSDF